MDLGIKDKLALVTGAGRSIGKGIAVNLAREGARVAVVARTKEDIDKVVDEMGGKEAGHYAAVVDLVEKNGPAKLIKDLKENFGDPEIIVHNLGGTADVREPFCSIEEWQKVYRINLEIGIELNLAYIPTMQNKKWGRVCHVSSISAMENQGPITYCSMKAALTAYTRSFGRLLAPDGIIMTSVLPGAIFDKGNPWDKDMQARPEHVEKYLKERMAIQRFGTLDEVGTVVAFLCSKHASFCVGSVVPVDGGQGRSFFNQ